MQDNQFFIRENHPFGQQNERRNSLQAQNDQLGSMVRPESLTRQNQILGREQFNYDHQVKYFDNDFRKDTMVPLNTAQDSHIDNYFNAHGDNTINTKAHIKQYIFSTIDNVLGGGQSSTAQIAQNLQEFKNNMDCMTQQQYTQQYQEPHYQQMSSPTYFQSAPNTVRPEKPKLNLKYDMFGSNVLEDDDHKNSLSPTLNKQQKLFDDGKMNSNGNMINENLKTVGIDNLVDQSLFNNIGISLDQSHKLHPNVCHTSSHLQAQFGMENSKMLFQNAVNYEDEQFQIRKIKSYNDAHTGNSPNKIMSSSGKDFDSQNKEINTKKRSRKAYTKKNKKIDEENQIKNIELASLSESKQFADILRNEAAIATQHDKKSTSTGVRFAPDIEENAYYNEDSLEALNDQSCTNDINVARLTNKKKQYLQDAIFDKNGAYSYLEDPIEYKKARKRLQNRESAVRSRQRKKSYQEELEQMIEDQNKYIQDLRKSQKHFKEQTASLTNENQVLKQQVSYFQETFANSSLVGGNQQSVSQSIDIQDTIIKSQQLDELKAEILSKLNRRFQGFEYKQKNDQSLNEHQYLIQPDIYDNLHIDNISNTKEALDQIMDDDLIEQETDQEIVKRPRLYSGCIQKSSTSEGTNESHDTLILKRDSSTSIHSKGYFCLAVVFGMMCASSLAKNGSSDGKFKEPLPRQPTAVFTSGRLPKSIENSMEQPAIEQRMNNLNLMSNGQDEQLSDDLIQKIYTQKEVREKKITLQNTAHMMKSLGHLNTPNLHNALSAGLHSGFMKTIMTGKYCYLTHLMCSTACFFFWMSPNAYKMRYIKPSVKQTAQRF